jgi:hypothetical protein
MAVKAMIGVVLAQVTLIGTMAGSSSALTAVSVEPAPVETATSQKFVPITPWRAFDTRTTTRLAPGEVRRVPLAARVPAGAVAVAVNVTGTGGDAATFLTLWPAGRRPSTANLNLSPRQTRSNAAIVGLGSDRSVSLYNDRGSQHVIIDVTGYFIGGFTGITPRRAMDTRSGLGGARLGPAATRRLVVRGVNGVPAQATAVALNVTATRATAATFVTVWPDGNRPVASNLNVSARTTSANLVVTGIGSDGAVRLYSDRGQVDLIVDVLGWFAADSGFVPATPRRVLDTRAATCGVRLGPGETRTLRVTERTDRSGAVLNVAAVGATAPTFITVWPTGGRRPSTSTLNVSGPSATPNLAIVGLGAEGQVDLYNDKGTVDLVVDLAGTLVGPTPRGSVITCPLVAPPGRASDLLERPALHRAVGEDVVLVVVCRVPSDSTNLGYAGAGRVTIEPSSVAAWATTQVSPYFAAVSGGRYRVRFEAGPSISLPRAEGPNECVERARNAASSPNTNVFATDDTDRGDGFGSAGFISTDTALDGRLLASAPVTTRRGFWVGGGSVVQRPAPRIVAHELGHTMHWPHSYGSLTGATSDEYDSTIDLMSGWPTNTGTWCSSGLTRWPCRPQHTLAFNRMAAGWVDDSQLGVHRSGTSRVLLVAPTVAGTQLLAVPASADRRVVLTIEARPRIGFDDHLDTAGVVLHVIDQRPSACAGFGSIFGACLSTFRRTIPARSALGRSDHVLDVGATRTLLGVTVRVVSSTSTGFVVEVTGSFTPPARFALG